MIAEMNKIEHAARLSFGDFTEARQMRQPSRSGFLAPVTLVAAALVLPVAALLFYS